LLDRGELTARFEWLNLENVAVGSLGMSGEGWCDGHLLMQGFRKRAQSQGVEYRYRALVGLTRRGEGGFEIVLDDGGVLHCDQVVNVAGVSAPKIAALLGVKVPVIPVKQSVFNFTSPFAPDRMPYLFTPDGLFCRPEGRGYIAGIGIGGQHDAVDPFDVGVDYQVFDDEIWPRLAARASGFEEVRFQGGWAGHYDMSLFDHNPFVGPVEGLPGYFMASGFSGHGLMQSPAIGRALSELLVYGHYQTLDLAPLSFDRIRRDAPIVERIQY
jgi:glycine/D-amino acid oxidase-like deaminating enzyme